jgi:hypothetical protein
MRPQQLVRGGLVVMGSAIGLFGIWSLLRLGVSNLLWAAVWLAGGVLAHDVALTAVTLGLVAVGLLVLPRWARAPFAVGFVVLGSVTVMAIPVLGRFGARPDNPSLLDRSYGVGWLVLAGIVAVGVTAASAVARRREAARVDGGHG